MSGPPEPWQLGFLLGPRINAGGRIGCADLGVRLLLEEDAVAAASIAAELDRLNRERQVIEQATLAEAEAEATAALGLDEKGAVVVTAGQNWHVGVVGLVAARLKERFGRPATRPTDRKSTRLNSSHVSISYAVFCLKKKNKD